MNNICKCRLCKNNNGDLMESHIIPKLFFKKLKNDSFTGYLRDSDNPNIRRQDGEKLEFLCEQCEALFNHYETWFANNLYNTVNLKKGLDYINTIKNELAYFLLSVSWRVLQLLKEKGISGLYEDEYDIIDSKLEEWRKALLNEDFSVIKWQYQYIIPTAKLSYFKDNPNRIKNNIFNDFHFYREGNNRVAFVFVQVPYLIFITSIYGNKRFLKSNQIGGKIVPRDTKLPDNIKWQLDKLHYEDTAKMASKISDKQKEILKKEYANYQKQQGNHSTYTTV